ncbi:hypothetical protein I8751_17210 [Nostocaceae cyanobacterium CENA357]|uniref:Uncharacterized protein n=1 Tax=Atlanticothrix silvestris CENA357 TaxID=1725252 RepID=A0A8J7L4X8_9CYAN|nr:hypothetical protein [Atlanticothrix silvestris]MBH8554072.1 hypothetical protein [Atlanticothrix silvestris CENA357]
MSKFQIDIDFSSVDLASLETEEDYQREAKILLPQALFKVGETIGEKTWEELNKNLKEPGMKQRSSQSEKRRFIQETGRTYQRKASSREKQELEEYIVEQLRTYHKP